MDGFHIQVFCGLQRKEMGRDSWGIHTV